MEIEAVGAQGGVERFNAVIEQARRLAEARQAEVLQNQGVSSPAPTAPVVSNPSFSPAIYAQAAQYQLYTQSGALASLTQNAHSPPVNSRIDHDPIEVTAVAKTEGGSVDTLV